MPFLFAPSWSGSIAMCARFLISLFALGEFILRDGQYFVERAFEALSGERTLSVNRRPLPGLHVGALMCVIILKPLCALQIARHLVDLAWEGVFDAL